MRESLATADQFNSKTEGNTGKQKEDNLPITNLFFFFFKSMLLPGDTIHNKGGVSTSIKVVRRVHQVKLSILMTLISGKFVLKSINNV